MLEASQPVAGAAPPWVSMRCTSVTPWRPPGWPFDVAGMSNHATEPASGDGAFFAFAPSPLAPLPSLSVHVGPAPCVPAAAPSEVDNCASGATSFHSAPPVGAVWHL